MLLNWTTPICSNFPANYSPTFTFFFFLSLTFLLPSCWHSCPFVGLAGFSTSPFVPAVGFPLTILSLVSIDFFFHFILFYFFSLLLLLLFLHPFMIFSLSSLSFFAAFVSLVFLWFAFDFLWHMLCQYLLYCDYSFSFCFLYCNYCMYLYVFWYFWVKTQDMLLCI